MEFSALTRQLRARIAAQGPISFRDFMEAALYDPAHGYYAGGKARIGRKGDFFTSVSVGSLFGTLLARQFIEIWQNLGRPERFDVVEQGTHDGTLAADVLAAFAHLAPCCPVRFTIVEPSAYWREKQQAKLSADARPSPVRWVESVEALEPVTGVCFSNELPDAFPVHLIHRVSGGWRERAVDVTEDAFVFADTTLSNERLAQYAAALPPMPDGAFAEVNLAAIDWMKALARKIQRGIALIVDYGFSRAELDAPHRREGTLEAFAAHRRQSDPLANPGEVDLTTHVDFTALAEAAEHEGLATLGFTDQHHFLVGISRSHFAEGVLPDPREMRAFQTLSHPTLLGRSFKVLAAGRDMPAGLSGFAFAKNPREALGLP
jgi:SAM-dependent MidA family methyltransferase